MELADKAVAFINGLTHTGDYNGEPFALRTWQEHEIVRPLFATDSEGRRIVRQAFLALPRKQGKTELIAAIALVLLVALNRKGQHIYSASGDRAQAALIYRAAATMVRNNRFLSSIIIPYDEAKKLVYPRGDSFYEALSSDAPLKHGLGPSAVLFDELHVLPNRELFDILTTGFGARREPLTLMITTAGHDRHSLCYEQWDYARKVRDGVIENPAFLPVLYEIRDGENWEDEGVWRRVMPALGDFCSLEFIKDEYRKAKEIPTFENRFRQLYLNEWTAQAVRWLPMDKWEACGRLGEKTNERGADNGGSADGGTDEKEAGDYRGYPCYVGIDLSTTVDLSAMVMLYVSPDGETLYAEPFFWVPEESAELRERRDRVPYRTWARQGHIDMTPGPVIDYGYIREVLEELRESRDIRKVYIDPYNATQFALDLQSLGFPVEFIRQGYLSLSSPTKELLRLVLAGKLLHPANPVLDWNADNAVIETDPAGNIKLSKRRSTEKIDGLAALVNAIAAARSDGMMQPDPYSYSGGLFIL